MNWVQTKVHYAYHLSGEYLPPFGCIGMDTLDTVVELRLAISTASCIGKYSNSIGVG